MDHLAYAGAGSAAMPSPVCSDPHKRLATAQARAALRGMTLRRIDGDDGRPLYVATFHALTRSFDDLAEVETWLEMVDGKRESRGAPK